MLKTYACYHLDEEIRLQSSSGAVFSGIASIILKKGGIVYGVVMSEDCYNAQYLRATTLTDIEKMRGSKYLQVTLGDVFYKVKKDLCEGREVLFTGTGCHVIGLKKYLQRDYDNLICLDIICHGVPSAKLWKKYLENREKTCGKVRQVNFRCKDNGWAEFGIKKDQTYISKEQDAYMQFFLRDYCLRPSCYNCVARKIKMSDITMADFWGVQNELPSMNDNKGISVVLVRTEKGQTIFNEIAEEYVIQEIDYKTIIKYNPPEYKSPHRPVQRDTFYSDMNSMNFNELEKKYIVPLSNNIFARIKRKVKRVLHI